MSWPASRTSQAQNYYEEPIPTILQRDKSGGAPQYVGRVHQFPCPSTRSGLVRDVGRGTLLAYGVLEEPELVFTPSPSTPDPQTIREALSASDVNDWRTATGAKIEDMYCYTAFKEVLHPVGKNITTPRWVFRRKFDNGTLAKHKARLAA